jgi:hypothetical protein
MLIKLILSNFPTITTLIVVVSVFLSSGSLAKNVEKQILRWLVGVLFLWGGLSHLLFPEVAAKAIGWKVSAVGIAGILASFSKFKNLIPGVIFIYSIFTFYAGLNHLYEMIVLNNKNKNNTGFVLLTDLLVPIVLIIAHFKK